MGSGYGLAALAGILGGIGTGGYKGIDAGIEDRLNQDKLAETKRQFDEGRFTDMSTIPPALRAALGLTDDVTGKVHASLVPSILSAADKAQTARTTAEKNTRVGDALENNTFGRAGDVPVSAQAPGMLAPDARVPDPQIAALGPIARAGEADRSMGVLSELLKQRAVGDNPKVTTTYKDARDESGENRIFALSHDARGKHLGSQDTGLRSAGSKSSLDAAITAFQSNPTPENLQRLNALAGFVPIAPGGAVAPKAGLAGMTAPGQMSGTGPSQSPFVVSRDALPSGAEREDMAKLDSAKTQLEAVVQALKAGNLNTVLGGVAKNPSGAFGRLSEEYLGFGMDDEQRRTLGTMAMQLQQVKHALIGATRTRPELADVAAAIPDEKSFLRGDTAEQMLPKLEALLISLKSERYSRENIMGSTGVAVPARPPVAPAPPRPPAAPAPPQPAQHPEGRRLYSPSQKRWYVIRGGQPVPE